MDTLLIAYRPLGATRTPNFGSENILGVRLALIYVVFLRGAVRTCGEKLKPAHYARGSTISTDHTIHRVSVILHNY